MKKFKISVVAVFVILPGIGASSFTIHKAAKNGYDAMAHFRWQQQH